MNTSLITTLLAVLLLAYANGANDISKAVATLVGSGVATYRQAVVWGMLWTVVGAWLGGTFAAAMVKTFATGIFSEVTALPPHFPLAVASGAFSWVLFASRAGLPVSTTHALTGAVCGAALLVPGEGGVLWSALGEKVAIPLAVSPFLTLLATLGLFPAVQHTLGRWRGSCLCVSAAQEAFIPIENVARAGSATVTPPALIMVSDVPENCEGEQGVAFSLTRDTFHWLSSGLVSFARGLNDAPKIVAPAVAATCQGPRHRGPILN